MDLVIRFLLQGPTLTNAIVSILLAANVWQLLPQPYCYTHRGLSYEHTVMAALVKLTPIVSIVTLYMRGDPILSLLGLIGVFFIIYFHTTNKDTCDMVFLFWVIAIGLGSGIYNWGIVDTSSLIIVFLVAILYFIRIGFTDFILVTANKDFFESKEATVMVQRYCTAPQLRPFNAMEAVGKQIFELQESDPHIISTIKCVRDLKDLPDVENVPLFSPKLSLPL